MTGDSTAIGVLGSSRGARVDRAGRVQPELAAWELDWWIGAEDRWHFPGRDVAVRQTLIDGMPVVQTAMRVPGGDAVQRAYGARGDVDVAVVEVVNDSRAPFVAAVVVRGARQLSLDAGVAAIDGRLALRSTRSPSRWAVTSDGTTEEVVVSGAASDDVFGLRHDRGGRLVGAFLYPVAHRTTLRVAIALGRNGLGDQAVETLPGADDVVHGWRAQLDRAMRVELPEPGLDSAVVTARAALLLAGQAWQPDPEVVATMERWGFDAETAAAWSRLTGRGRRRAGRYRPVRTSWSEVRALAPMGGAPFLDALRDALVREEDARLVLVDHWPDEWHGHPLDVRDAPTRQGPVSFSVRWHGERPALLWDVPVGLSLCAPGLDPEWSSTNPRGEALLKA